MKLHRLFSLCLSLGYLSLSAHAESLPAATPLFFRMDVGGHTERIMALAALADGKVAVSAGFEGDVRFWDMASGLCTSVWRAEKTSDGAGKIYTMAVSPDRRLIAVGGWLTNQSSPEYIVLIDAQTRRPIGRLVGSRDGIIHQLTFSADGRYIAAGNDKSVLLWSVADRTLRHTWKSEAPCYRIGILTGSEGMTAIVGSNGKLLSGRPGAESLVEANDFGEVVSIEAIAVAPKSRRVALAVNSKLDAAVVAQRDLLVNAIILMDENLTAMGHANRGVLGSGSSLVFNADESLLAAGSSGLTSNSRLTMKPRIYAVSPEKLVGRGSDNSSETLREFADSATGFGNAALGWLDGSTLLVAASQPENGFGSVKVANDQFKLVADWSVERWVRPTHRLSAVDTVDWVDQTLLFRRSWVGGRSTGRYGLDHSFDLKTLTPDRIDLVNPSEPNHLNPQVDLDNLHVRFRPARPGGWWTEQLVLSHGDPATKASDKFGTHDAGVGTEIFTTNDSSGWRTATLAPGRMYVAGGTSPLVYDTSAVADNPALKYVPLTARLVNAPVGLGHGAPSADKRWYAIGGTDGVIAVWLTEAPWRRRINKVAPGGAAEAAGLKEGDIVIGFDGKQFADEKDVESYQKNRPMLTFDVERDGSPRALSIARREGRFGYEEGSSLLKIEPSYRLLVSGPEDKEWIVWTEHGYFDCSPGSDAKQWLGYQINYGPDKAAGFVTLAQLSDKLHQPAVVREVVASGRSDVEVARKLGVSSDLNEVVKAVVGAQLLALIRQVNEKLKAEDYEEVLSLTKTALQTEPDDFYLHYYQACAQTGLGSLNEALATGMRAAKLASTQEKPTVEKLLTLIRTQKTAIVSRQEVTQSRFVSEALAAGRTEQAVLSYEQMLEAEPTKTEFGLKAAELYVQKLQDPLEARRVLRQTLKSAPNQEASRIKVALNDLAEPLKKQAKELLEKAQQTTKVEEKIELLDRAEQADPTLVEINRVRLAFAAAGSSGPEMRSALLRFAQHYPLGKEQIEKLPNFERWKADPATKALVRDIVGGPQLSGIIEIPGLNLKLMPIGAGSFAMGSTNGSGDEQPVTRVTISQAYWLGATEVTQGQWVAVMGNNPSEFKGTKLPVEKVSYDEALAFCRKVTEQERAAGRLPAGYEFTLPTEAQWEYACRAGTTGDYAGNLDAMGWYDGNSGGKTHEVGGKQANEWGLYDMHGNVWEWCLDLKGAYAGGNVTDPRGATSGSDRVNRGGGWGNSAFHCRAANRYRNSPGNRYSNLGFRLALSSVR